MIQNIPAFISACCVTLYWTIVVVKSVRLYRKIGKTPNVIPREKLGRKLRYLWAPVVLLWIAQTWIGTHKLIIHDKAEYFAQFVGAFIVMMATLSTLVCWHKMGTSWRIGIDPNEKTQLIITGPYQCIRHPIYSLSILLAIGTFLSVPTFFMLITILIHINLLIFEAIREEKYLIQQHGEFYLSYMKSVGRFIPKQCFPG